MESITHKDEISDILTEAEELQKKSLKEFNDAKSEAEKRLTEYGETKLNIYNNSLTKFLTVFSAFKNVDVKELNLSNNQLVKADVKNTLSTINNDVTETKQLIKTGLTAAGVGAVSGIAAYGGAKAFGLIGATAAKTIGGKIAFVAPFVFIPALIVFGVGTAAAGKAKLAEAKATLKKVEAESSKVKTYVILYKGISDCCYNYNSFLAKYNERYLNIVERVAEIANEHPRENDGKISFNSLSETDQKTLQLSWLMTQLVYGVLKQPLLNSEGKLSEDAPALLAKTKNEVAKIERQYPVEVAKVLNNPKNAANKWLVPNFIVMGASIIMSGYYFYENNLLASIPILVIALICFPFSIFIKKWSAKAKLIIRIIRFAVCLIALSLIVYMQQKP